MWYCPIDERIDCPNHPLVRYHENPDYAYSELGGCLMEFRLVYRGKLFAARDSDNPDRLKQMHDIRREMHKQLDELWKTNFLLKDLRDIRMGFKDDSVPSGTRVNTRLEENAKMHESFGIRWAPLICNAYGLLCRMEILFLRPESKGGVVHSGGDLDNRIKTLFDALRIPSTKQLPDSLDAKNEPSPFFCLLEDDNRIIDFRVIADRLLEPCAPSEVQLVIKVQTILANTDRAYIEFGYGV